MKHAIIALTAALCASCTSGLHPDVASLQRDFPLGSSLQQVRAAAALHCASMSEREFTPEESAPYAQQAQIDCRGYQWRGAPRLIELLVNEGELGFYWVLVNENELAALQRDLRAQGEPACSTADYVSYPAFKAAVRTAPPELLIAEPAAFAAITGCAGP